MGVLVEKAQAAEEVVAKIEHVADKMPLESKKFWALLICTAVLFMVLLVSGVAFLHLSAEIVMHTMDKLVMLTVAYFAGQSAQDLMDSIKGK